MDIEKRFFMPAEWEQHSATQLHWPSNSDNWSEEMLGKLEEMFCNIIEELHFFEVIHLFVENLKARNRVMNRLSLKAVDLDRIVIHQKKINDIWARDCGPIFAKDEQGSKVILNWGFNAWGEKYKPWSDDNTIPSFVAKKYNIKMYRTRYDP
ncbi:MAG: agmatine deiminase family protein [Gracilimonas sp.]|nr:agmatine deiminase family protein [Gracilimonas sp.]